MKVARFRIVTYRRILNLEICDYEWTHYIEDRKDLFISFDSKITNEMMVNATENKLWFHIEYKSFYFIHWDNTREHIHMLPDRPNGICDWKYWPNNSDRVYYLLKLINVVDIKEEQYVRWSLEL